MDRVDHGAEMVRAYVEDECRETDRVYSMCRKQREQGEAYAGEEMVG